MFMEAYAKVNLRLKVLGKRSDNYHNLEMINISTDLADKIGIKTRNDGMINITSNRNDLPVDSRNLVYQVCDFMKANYQITDGFDIYIEKNIPMGAGLGGGSSDCAATLRWFYDKYHLNPDLSTMLGQALKFGSDVPYCLFGKTAFARSKGEDLQFISLRLPKYILVVTPNIFVSTKDIFTAYDQNQPEDLKYEEPDLSKNIYDLMENDLEHVTFKLFPCLKEIKSYVETFGFEKVRMSGSGPTLFALTDDYRLGSYVLEQYRLQYPLHFASLNKIIG
jgi:4-diphosphocytidyl-2-C-methyl-D-erythritol kinase